MMFDFEKISMRQILVLSDILAETTLLSDEFIRSKYQRESVNFDNTVQFLTLIGLVKMENNGMILSDTYKNLLNKIEDSSQKENLINDLVVNNLTVSTNPELNQLKRFISRFYTIDNRCEFKPDTKQRLEYSGVRNLLMELGIVYLDNDNDIYIIADKYVPQINKYFFAYNVSPAEFRRTQENNLELAELAEREILEYEKKRLSDHPEIVKQIEHTARINVAAGYDIKSYSVDKAGNITPRYIEVKAVSLVDYGFYWTKNEIEKSKVYGNSYYLYLLPVVTTNKFAIENLKLILDPFSRIYNNHGEWNKQEEAVSFRLNTEAK